MKQAQTQSRAATVAPSAADSQHEATKAALRVAIEQGTMGIGGAIASYPELTVSQIIQTVSEVVKGRASE